MIKLVQLVKFDLTKTLYNMSNVKANFNMSNYLIFNLIFCSFVNDHYIFFNQIFNNINDTCLGVTYSYYFGSTDTYFSNASMVTLFLCSLLRSSLQHFCYIYF